MIRRWSNEGPDINALEMEALLLAVRYMGWSQKTPDKRMAVLLDSTVSLGALSKDISSSRRPNSVCRKVAAATVLAAVQLVHYWVPTAIRPADGPSRRFDAHADEALVESQLADFICRSVAEASPFRWHLLPFTSSLVNIIQVIGGHMDGPKFRIQVNPEGGHAPYILQVSSMQFTCTQTYPRKPYYGKWSSYGVI